MVGEGGGGGVTDFILERTCLEEYLNLSKSGFISEEGHSSCKSQNIAIRALKGNVLYQSTVQVPPKTSSHLATIVPRALQQQDGRIPFCVDRNLEFLNFLTSHLIFCLVLDNVEIIANKICF